LKTWSLLLILALLLVCSATAAEQKRFPVSVLVIAEPTLTSVPQAGVDQPSEAEIGQLRQLIITKFQADGKHQIVGWDSKEPHEEISVSVVRLGGKRTQYAASSTLAVWHSDLDACVTHNVFVDPSLDGIADAIHTVVSLEEILQKWDRTLAPSEKH
jgi:hypothetical protein